MIFQPINNIKTSADKSFLEELVSVYCKIVHEICRKNGLPYEPKDIVPTDVVLQELNDMGLICEPSQINLLSKQLSSYAEFIYCVDIFVNNRKLFGNLLDKLNNKKRKEIQHKESLVNKPKIADFFAGAGGLSLGFIQSGFHVAFANDFEEVCVNTYRYNHPETPTQDVLQADIRTIVDNITDYIKTDIDVVIGGPPCQGFSSANQQRIIDDPRNELYKYYLKAVEKLAPKFVVMENVRGMLSVADQVVEDYQAIKAIKNGKEYSYTIEYKILNSADFSVAQSRERLIYIAIRNDIAQSKHITPKDIFEQIEKSCKGHKVYNLADALALSSLLTLRVSRTQMRLMMKRPAKKLM